MVQVLTFRPLPELTAQLDTLAQSRKCTRTDIINSALQIALPIMQDGRHTNSTRLATLIEFIAAHVDLIGKKLNPEDAEIVPSVVRSRMEQYHGQV